MTLARHSLNMAWLGQFAGTHTLSCAGFCCGGMAPSGVATCELCGDQGVPCCAGRTAQTFETLNLGFEPERRSNSVRLKSGDMPCNAMPCNTMQCGSLTQLGRFNCAHFFYIFTHWFCSLSTSSRVIFHFIPFCSIFCRPTSKTILKIYFSIISGLQPIFS